MAGWAAIAAASISQLVWRHPLAAVAGRAVAPAGATFAALCLATGSIWGRPTWGTWWEWDGRLTSMLILFFLYLGYIALASAERERGGEGRMAALFGLVGAVNLPIIHYSVLWWRTLHQGQIDQHHAGLVDRAGTAVAAAADHGRLHRHIRCGGADADARRACPLEARSPAPPERRRMNQWTFVIGRLWPGRDGHVGAGRLVLSVDARSRGGCRGGQAPPMMVRPKHQRLVLVALAVARAAWRGAAGDVGPARTAQPISSRRPTSPPARPRPTRRCGSAGWSSRARSGAMPTA